KKAEKTSNPAVTAAIVKCVCALVCTGIVCGSIISCTNKYSDAIKTAPSDVDVVATAEDTDNAVEDSVSEDTTDANADAQTEDNTDVEDVTQAADDNNTAENPVAANKSEEKTKAKQGNKALTTAEIINKFNTASNKIKSGSKSIKQNYCENTQVSTPEINNGVIKSAADKLISANMGRDKTKNNVIYSTPADKQAKYPIAGQSYTSKLTESDVKSATISTSGNISTITIKLKDDTTPNTGTHAKKAFSVVTKEQIVDGAGSFGMKFIKEESIGLSYSNGVIKVKIDEKTGNVIAANYYIQWKLSLATTVAGLNVAVAFGLEEDYTINW
ncbi:MAG: hypothetical protein KBT46_01865, partial [Ruminococcus sp.]|nr:hypothetical protein [Candidatus Copronaster equi]